MRYVKPLCLFVVVLVALSLPAVTVQGDASWHGYMLVRFSSSLAAAGESVLERALGSLGPLAGSWPPWVLQARWNPARDSAILEARWYQLPDKTDVAIALAEYFQLAYADVQANLTVQVFAPGGVWEQSHAEAMEFLIQHQAEWEPAP